MSSKVSYIHNTSFYILLTRPAKFNDTIANYKVIAFDCIIDFICNYEFHKEKTPFLKLIFLVMVLHYLQKIENDLQNSIFVTTGFYQYLQKTSCSS